MTSSLLAPPLPPLLSVSLCGGRCYQHFDASLDVASLVGCCLVWKVQGLFWGVGDVAGLHVMAHSPYCSPLQPSCCPLISCCRHHPQHYYSQQQQGPAAAAASDVAQQRRRQPAAPVGLQPAAAAGGWPHGPSPSPTPEGTQGERGLRTAGRLIVGRSCCTIWQKLEQSRRSTVLTPRSSRGHQGAGAASWQQQQQQHRGSSPGVAVTCWGAAQRLGCWRV